MSFSVIELLNREKPAIQRAIDLTLSNRSATGATYRDGMPDPAMMQYIPETSYMSPEAAFMKFLRKRPTLAYIRGVDGEVITDRETLELTEERIGNVNITKGVIWTEADFKVIKKIMDLQRSGGAGNVAAAREMMDVYKSTPAALSESWANTLFMLCQRVQVCGKALYTDEMSNIPVEIDYTADIPSGHLATTLTTTARWSQASTADGIANLSTHLNAVYANLRMFPPAIAMGYTEADNLRNQASTKVRVARMKGIITDGATVADTSNLPRPSLQDVQDVLATELTSSAQSSATPPRLVVSDALWYRRTKAGSITSGSYLPAGYYTFLWNGVIEAARFPTVSNDFAGGLAIKTERKDFPPISEKLAVDGCGIPLVADARYIAACNVENTALS
jgi:hypothetical protein